MSDPLADLAAKAEEDAAYLGFALARDRLGLTDGGLAARLGCTPGVLVRLKLCLAPRPETNDLGLIVKTFRLDPWALEALLTPLP